MNSVYMLINTGFNASNGCVVFWDKASNHLFLMDDAAATFSGPLTAANLSNTQCTLNFTVTQVTTSGTQLKMTLALAFHKPPVTGTQQLWTYAYDNGDNSGGVQKSTLTIP